MREIASSYELSLAVRRAKCDQKFIGFVPTMGYLHQGHAELIRRATNENDVTVTSIYVNPTQFGPTEDFAQYPRDVGQDRTLCEECGIDFLFLPSDNDMYPQGLAAQDVWVTPGRLAERLDGAARPGHFRGVATVVMKLFNIVQPDRAYFGEKDAQQCAIIRAMVRDIAVATEIRTIPTVRESDGLAMSSRNVNLSPGERAQAPAIKHALDAARAAFAEGVHGHAELIAIVASGIKAGAPAAKVDYIDIVDAENFASCIDQVASGNLCLIAVFFGSTRLIDNVTL